MNIFRRAFNALKGSLKKVFKAPTIEQQATQKVKRENTKAKLGTSNINYKLNLSNWTQKPKQEPAQESSCRKYMMETLFELRNILEGSGDAKYVQSIQNIQLKIIEMSDEEAELYCKRSREWKALEDALFNDESYDTYGVASYYGENPRPLSEEKIKEAKVRIAKGLAKAIERLM